MSTYATHPPVAVHAADMRAGILAGLLAGLLMTVPMMAVAAFLIDLDAWAAPKMAWSLVAGREVIRPGFELVPVVGGVIVHLGLSAVYGLVFAGLAALFHSGSVLLGAAFGIGLYVVNILLVPTLFPSWAGHMYPANALMHVISAAEHAFFGFVWAWAYGGWRRGI